MGRNRLNYFCAVGVAVLFCLLVVMYMHERKQRAERAEENRQTAARVEAEAGQHKAAVSEIRQVSSVGETKRWRGISTERSLHLWIIKSMRPFFQS